MTMPDRTSADGRAVDAGDKVTAEVVWASPETVVVAAPAKLNLFLELRGRRADGYHELETLMVAVDLYDTLEVRCRDDSRIELTCDPPGLPTGPGNLVWKAADALRRMAGKEFGADIRLTKRIPHEAGLGGGSSDAAAALVALNRLWGLGYGRPALTEVAAMVGSDVGFFLAGPAAWCTGRGELVEPETVGGELNFVVVKPPVGLSTVDVYRRVTVPPDPASGDAIRAAVRAGDPAEVGRQLHNRLEGPAFVLGPKIGSVVAAAAARLRELNPLGCRLSGSGSSVFAVCRDRADAVRIARQFLSDGPDGRPCDLAGHRAFAVRSVRRPGPQQLD